MELFKTQQTSVFFPLKTQHLAAAYKLRTAAQTLTQISHGITQAPPHQKRAESATCNTGDINGGATTYPPGNLEQRAQPPRRVKEAVQG
ncbi:hypothetical protein AKJ16_DCAP01727 [Drosera capensis]